MTRLADSDMPALQVGDLGLPEVASCHFDVEHADRIAATLDSPKVHNGDRLPPLWHWAFLTPTVATADLGADGHPSLGSGLVKRYPRRMWGAGRLEWTGDLVVGDRVTRTSSVRRARVTDGRTGRLLLVSLEHVLRRDAEVGEVVLREEQSLVYRTPGIAVPMPEGVVPVDTAAEDTEALRESWTPTPPLLFRFSAVTFNSHRIHYDKAYAGDVEGYPTLVVQAPLTAMRLAGLVERSLERQLASFAFKAAAPLFVGLRALLVVKPTSCDSDEGTATVIRNDGIAAFTATYRVRTQ